MINTAQFVGADHEGRKPEQTKDIQKGFLFVNGHHNAAASLDAHEGIRGEGIFFLLN